MTGVIKRGSTFALGFTLIEVLIALLVLAIGLVGLAALLISSLSNVHSSTHYSLASVIALDFEERVWGEMSRVGNTLASGKCLNDLTDESTNRLQAIRDDLVMQWSGKTPKDDIWNWSQSGARLTLPGLKIEPVNPVGTSVCGSLEYPCLTVAFTISWDESRFEDIDDREEYVASFSVPCRPSF